VNANERQVYETLYAFLLAQREGLYSLEEASKLYKREEQG